MGEFGSTRIFGDLLVSRKGAFETIETEGIEINGVQPYSPENLPTKSDVGLSNVDNVKQAPFEHGHVLTSSTLDGDLQPTGVDGFMPWQDHDKLKGIAFNANNYVHPDHTGDVTGSAALTISNGAVTLEKMANLATARIIGRTSSGTGVPQALTAANVRSMINVADGANNYVHPGSGTNPHGTTKSDVGLGNVDNHSQAHYDGRYVRKDDRSVISTTSHTSNSLLALNATNNAGSGSTLLSGSIPSQASDRYLMSFTGSSNSVTWRVSTDGVLREGRIPWARLESVPSTFAPSAHNHDASEITTGRLDSLRLPTIIVSGTGSTGGNDDANTSLRFGTRGTPGEHRNYMEFQGVSANDANNEDGGAFIKFRTSTAAGFGPEMGAVRKSGGNGDFLIKTGGSSPTERFRIFNNGDFTFQNGTMIGGNIPWARLNDVPTTFTPTAHDHEANEVTETSSKKFVSDTQIDSWDNKVIVEDIPATSDLPDKTLHMEIFYELEVPY